MLQKASDVIQKLRGRTLVTAESCTGGGIGNLLTAVPGASEVYKGGVISYTNEVKQRLLKVKQDVLEQYGAVSAPVAEQMALGAKNLLNAEFALSVTGLAGPGGDEFGNPVGTVYIGLAWGSCVESRHFLFSGDRQKVRQQAVEAALTFLLEKL